MHGVAGPTREEALRDMVRRLASSGLLADEKLFLSLLLEREAIMSTAIIDGVAVPHPRRTMLRMFDESMVALGISGKGIDFGESSRPVHVIFLICARDDREHLLILARIVELLKETALIERIAGAISPDEVMSVIKGEEASLASEKGHGKRVNNAPEA